MEYCNCESIDSMFLFFNFDWFMVYRIVKLIMKFLFISTFLLWQLSTTFYTKYCISFFLEIVLLVACMVFMALPRRWSDWGPVCPWSVAQSGRRGGRVNGWRDGEERRAQSDRRPCNSCLCDPNWHLLTARATLKSPAVSVDLEDWGAGTFGKGELS